MVAGSEIIVARREPTQTAMRREGGPVADGPPSHEPERHLSRPSPAIKLAEREATAADHWLGSAKDPLRFMVSMRGKKAVGAYGELLTIRKCV